MGNCIGFFNHKYFLLFLFYGVISAFFVCVAMFNRMVHAFRPVWDVDSFLMVDCPILVAYIMCVMVVIVIGVFFGFHMHLVFKVRSIHPVSTSCSPSLSYCCLDFILSSLPCFALSLFISISLLFPLASRLHQGTTTIERREKLESDDALVLHRAHIANVKYQHGGAWGNFVHVFGANPLLWLLPFAATRDDEDGTYVDLKVYDNPPPELAKWDPYVHYFSAAPSGGAGTSEDVNRRMPSGPLAPSVGAPSSTAGAIGSTRNRDAMFGAPAGGSANGSQAGSVGGGAHEVTVGVNSSA